MFVNKNKQLLRKPHVIHSHLKINFLYFHVVTMIFG